MSGASSCCLLLWNMCQNGVVWNHLQAWHLIQLICFNQQICTDFYGLWSLLSWTKQSLRMRFVCLNFHGPRWPNARNASCTHFHHPQHLPQPDASEVWSGRKPSCGRGRFDAWRGKKAPRFLRRHCRMPFLCTCTVVYTIWESNMVIENPL